MAFPGMSKFRFEFYISYFDWAIRKISSPLKRFCNSVRSNL